MGGEEMLDWFLSGRDLDRAVCTFVCNAAIHQHGRGSSAFGLDWSHMCGR